jgi:hypothetical protein
MRHHHRRPPTVLFSEHLPRSCVSISWLEFAAEVDDSRLRPSSIRSGSHLHVIGKRMPLTLHHFDILTCNYTKMAGTASVERQRSAAGVGRLNVRCNRPHVPARCVLQVCPSSLGACRKKERHRDNCACAVARFTPTVVRSLATSLPTASAISKLCAPP